MEVDMEKNATQKLPDWVYSDPDFQFLKTVRSHPYLRYTVRVTYTRDRPHSQAKFAKIELILTWLKEFLGYEEHFTWAADGSYKAEGRTPRRECIALNGHPAPTKEMPNFLRALAGRLTDSAELVTEFVGETN
jgi:hypothetical protein